MALSELAIKCSYGRLFKVSFVALVYLDLLLTIFAWQHGFNELNPLMVRFLSRPGEMFAAKILAPPLIALLVPGRMLLPSVGFMLAINWWSILKLLGAS